APAAKESQARWKRDASPLNVCCLSLRRFDEWPFQFVLAGCIGSLGIVSDAGSNTRNQSSGAGDLFANATAWCFFGFDHPP
ncbi:MAG: hypothetical protein NTX31_07720, partial [Burkholderiales bacterium]|nr:hypothetical protein [Burkholderiales bacterium]